VEKIMQFDHNCDAADEFYRQVPVFNEYRYHKIIDRLFSTLAMCFIFAFIYLDVHEWQIQSLVKFTLIVIPGGALLKLAFSVALQVAEGIFEAFIEVLRVIKNYYLGQD
jgi:hypothetical protein